MTATDQPDRLAQATAALAELDHRPVEQHPEALEVLAQSVVAELDGLAGIGAAGDRQAGGGDRQPREDG